MRKAKTGLLESLHKFRSSACKTGEGDGYFSSFAKNPYDFKKSMLVFKHETKYCRLNTTTVKKRIVI